MMLIAIIWIWSLGFAFIIGALWEDRAKIERSDFAWICGWPWVALVILIVLAIEAFPKHRRKVA